MTTALNLTESKIAIGGYDPVSYYKDGPLEGSEGITSEHGGAVYRFASAENKAEFDANPGAFVPEYGGYCAIAMSEGKLFGIDPTNYDLDGDKLYLFYKGEAGDTKPDWVADTAARKANADQHWNAGDYAEHE